MLSPRQAAPALALLLLVAPSPAPAQTLIQDINASDGGRSSSPAGFAVAGGVMYFAATDATHGAELWRTDGTVAGTWMVIDAAPGGPSNPRNFAAAGNLVFFSANDGFSGEEPWVTDGTPAGTRMLRDVYPGPTSSSPAMFTALNGLVVFAAATSTPAPTGRELWRSDGTPGGTVLVKDIRPGATGGIPILTSLRAAVVGGLAVFAADDGTSGLEPWISDGTTAGTQLLMDVYPGTLGSSNGSSSLATAVGGGAYFLANLPTGQALWHTDGTPANTRALGGPSSLSLLTAWNGLLAFVGFSGSTGYELYTSDGTTTRLVRDIVPGGGSSQPAMLCAAGATLFFTATDTANGRELWCSDGTAAGTRLVADLLPGPSAGSYAEFTGHAGQLVFSYTYPNNPLGAEPWASDGTAAGTRLLRDIAEGTTPSSPTFLGAYAGRLWFAATELPRGRELWTTDLSTAGTEMFLNINASAATNGSLPSALTALGDRCLFFADDYVHGRELWASDGTAAGTFMVQDIDRRPAIAGIPTQGELVVLGDRVLFGAGDGSTGVELWSSDGTTAGTALVADIFTGAGSASPKGYQVMGDQVFFFARSSLGRELWVSDGTASGTRMVSDVWVGANDGAGDSATGLSDLLVIGDTVYFQGNNGVTGAELWKTDGTALGTVMVADLLPGPASSRPFRMCRLGNLLLFIAADGFSQVVWRSDGTAAGTYPIYLEHVVTRPSGPFGVVLGGRLFFSGMPLQQSAKLFATDGTLQGTVMVFDAGGGVNGTGAPALIGDRLVFQAWEPIGGSELYVSDGTTAGTNLVVDVFPGFAGSAPGNGCHGNFAQAGLGRLVVYTGANAAYGLEPWVSDLTAAGTTNIGDVRTGTTNGFGNSSYPQQFMVAGERVYFTADDGNHGSELFTFELAQIGGAQATLAGRGCPGTGGRIAKLTNAGAPVVGHAAFAVRVYDARPTSPCVTILGGAADLPIGGGCVLRATPDVLLLGATDLAGSYTQPLPLPASVALVGARVRLQAAVIDPQGAWQNSVALSDGLALLLGR